MLVTLVAVVGVAVVVTLTVGKSHAYANEQLISCGALEGYFDISCLACAHSDPEISWRCD